MKEKSKIIRVTTVPISMNIILKGQLAYMNEFYELVGVTGQDDKHFKDIAEREGIRMIPLPMSRTIRPYKDLLSLWAMFRLLQREKPQIIHTHTPKAGLIGMIAGWAAGVPVRLHTVGGIPWMESSGIKRKVLALVEKITYCFAHRIYPNSKGLAQFIQDEKLCPKEKIKVLGRGGSNGVNTDFFKSDPYLRRSMRSQYEIKDNEIILGFVGRIAREKGIVEWLEAYDKIKDKYPVKLLLVGVFEKENGILSEEIIQKIMTDDNILYLGRFDDVRPYYNMMDIFIFPSYREGFPNAVLEACSMSLPVIATNINGCNEIIIDKLTGLLIPPKSASALENAIITLLSNAELVSQLAKNSRENVVQNFRREKIWVALKDEYNYFLHQSQN